jgi:hypothetical protein
VELVAGLSLFQVPPVTCPVLLYVFVYCSGMGLF